MTGHQRTVTDRDPDERFKVSAECECGRWACIAESRNQAARMHHHHVQDLGKGPVRPLAEARP